jgi:CRP-like cAMP-binding protein
MSVIFIVNEVLMKIGERISENRIETLKQMFLSLKFITIFMRSLNMFEDWTLNSLEKLLYVAEMKTLSKREHVFCQGDDAKGFYIVFKGEVLVTYKLHKNYKEKLMFDGKMLKGPTKTPKHEHSTSQGHHQSYMEDYDITTERRQELDSYRQAYHMIINNSKKTHSITKDIEIKIIGPGQLLGAEDAVLNNSNHKTNNYSYTAICNSGSCKLLYFSKKK